MKKNLFPLIVIALVVAILSTGAFYWMVAGRFGEAQASTNRMVVVATRPLPAGTTLSGADLKLQAWHSGPAPDGAVSHSSEVAGKVLLQSVAMDEPVTRSRVAFDGGAAAVPKGMRAVSVLVSDSAGVVSLLRPGQRVDVQAVQARTPTDVDLRTIAEDIEVLKVQPPADAGPGRPPVPGLTLLVTPAEANTIALADSAARLRVSLRNPSDRQKSGLPVENLNTVMRGAAKPAAPSVTWNAAPAAARN